MSASYDESCASWLLAGKEPSPTLQARLNCLMQMAVCVEHAAKAAAVGTSISVLICARVAKYSAWEPVSPLSKTLVIYAEEQLRKAWDNESNARDASAVRNTDRGVVVNGNLTTTSGERAMHPTVLDLSRQSKEHGCMSWNDTEQQRRKLLREVSLDQRSGLPSTTLRIAPAQCNASSPAASIKILVTVAATCASLLLDGVGNTTHFDPDVESGYSTLSVKEKNVFVTAL